MAVNIGPKIGIDGEAEYRKQIQNLITETKTLKSAYQDVSSEVDSSTNAFERNKEMHKLLGEQIDTQKKKIDQLKKGVEESTKKFGEADPKTQKWEQALHDANIELHKMQAELETLPSQAEVLANKLQAAGDKLKTIGDGMQSAGRALTPVSTAAAGALAGSAKAAIDFESAFTGVRKTVDATEEEFGQLADWIKDASTRMASSKEDIAATMEVAGQLGITGVDNLETFTETMIMLGDTTNLSSEEAAGALARFMNITGESSSNAGKLGAAIVDLGNNFATDEAAIVEMSTRLASAGTIAGISSTDILALSTAMSSVGINAEAGGTAMTQTLTTITKAVAGLDNSQKGLDTAQKKVTTTSRALEDAQDNLAKKQLAYDEAVRKYAETDAKNQEKAQKAVQTATNQLADAQANAEKKQIAYSNAVAKYGEDSPQAQTALINMEQAFDKVELKTNALAEAQANLDKVQQGSTGNEKVQKALIDLEAAQRKVEEKTTDLQGAQLALEGIMDGSGSKLETLARVAGMSADDFAKAWNENPTAALQSFIAGLGSLDEESESTIAILDELGLDGIRQSNMLNALALSSDMLTDALKTSGDAYKDENALLDEASKRYGTYESKINQTKEKMSNLGIEIGERLLPYIDKGLDLVDRLITAWDSLDEDQQDTIVKIMGITAAAAPLLITGGKVVSGIGSIIGGVGKLSPVLGKIGGVIVGDLIPALGSLVAAAAPVITAAAPYIAIAAAIVAAGVLIYKNWDTIKEKAGELKDAVSEKWDGLKNKIAETDIGKAMSNMWTAAKETAMESMTKIRSAYDEHDGGLKGAVYAGMEAVKQYYTAGWNFVDNLTGGKLTEIKDKVANSKVAETIGNMWDAAKKTTKDALNDIRTAYDEHGGGLKGAVYAGMETVKQYYSAGWNYVDNLTDGKLTQISTTVKKKLGDTKDNITTAWNNIKSFTDIVTDQIKDKIVKSFETVKSKVSSIFDNVKNKIESAINYIKGLFDFEWSLPDLKVPHFSMEGGEAPWGLGGRGRFPEINIEWYAKAMRNGMRLTSPTIFGAAGGKLLGGGEVGNEWVVGESSLFGMIRSAVGSAVGYLPGGGSNTVTIGDTTINIYAQDGQDVEEIANAVDDILTLRYQQMEAAWA